MFFLDQVEQERALGPKLFFPPKGSGEGFEIGNKSGWVAIPFFLLKQVQKNQTTCGCPGLAGLQGATGPPWNRAADWLRYPSQTLLK